MAKRRELIKSPEIDIMFYLNQRNNDLSSSITLAMTVVVLRTVDAYRTVSTSGKGRIKIIGTLCSGGCRGTM